MLLADDSRRDRNSGLGEALGRLSGSDALILLLDELNDPHNLGAILRSADLFAVDLVVATARRSASESPGVLKSSAGASSYVPLVTVDNLWAMIRQVRPSARRRSASCMIRSVFVSTFEVASSIISMGGLARIARARQVSCR